MKAVASRGDFPQGGSEAAPQTRWAHKTRCSIGGVLAAVAVGVLSFAGRAFMGRVSDDSGNSTLDSYEVKAKLNYEDKDVQKYIKCFNNILGNEGIDNEILFDLEGKYSPIDVDLEGVFVNLSWDEMFTLKPTIKKSPDRAKKQVEILGKMGEISEKISSQIGEKMKFLSFSIENGKVFINSDYYFHFDGFGKDKIETIMTLSRDQMPLDHRSQGDMETDLIKTTAYIPGPVVKHPFESEVELSVNECKQHLTKANFWKDRAINSSTNQLLFPDHVFHAAPIADCLERSIARSFVRLVFVRDYE